MKIIVGLGNPGIRYRNTRHNAGFAVVSRLAKRHGIKIKKNRRHSKIGEGTINDAPVVLAKPQRFMNLSGLAVEALARAYRSRPEDIIVIHDDIDIAQGSIKVKHNGGDAGHKGIRSIMEKMGTGEFARIRVGVGRPAPGEDVVDYVLGRFGRDELSLMESAYAEALDAVESLLSNPD